MDYYTPSPVTSQQPSMQGTHYSQLLQADRESEGRCGLCGVQTHRMCYRDTVMGNMLCKEPLDVEGEVHRGRCLLCHPLPASVVAQMPDMDCMTANSSVSAASSGLCYMSPQRILGTNTSPNEIYDFPYRMGPQQQYMLPPLPLPTVSPSRHAAAMPQMVQQQVVQEPSMATIQSIPNADITTILSLMRNYSHNSALVTTALQTLQSLSEEQPDALALGRVGGIPTIVNSMTPYQGNIAINELGTTTLYNISKCPHNHSILASANTVPLLVRTMNTYPTHASIQRHSTLTLGNIAKYNIDYKILICEEGGMMAIMKAVEAFGQGDQQGGEEAENISESVLRAAYWSLRRLGMPRLRGLSSENSGEESDGEEGIGMDLFE